MKKLGHTTYTIYYQVITIVMGGNKEDQLGTVKCCGSIWCCQCTFVGLTQSANCILNCILLQRSRELYLARESQGFVSVLCKISNSNNRAAKRIQWAKTENQTFFSHFSVPEVTNLTLALFFEGIDK